MKDSSVLIAQKDGRLIIIGPTKEIAYIREQLFAHKLKEAYGSKERTACAGSSGNQR